MTTDAADFLSLLRSANFRVTGFADRLYVEPRERLTPADCETIRRLKPGLLALVVNELEKCSGPCGCSVQPAAKEDQARLCPMVHCPFKPDVPARAYTPKKRGGR